MDYQIERKLIVRHIPRSLSYGRLRRRFERYGQVKTLRLQRGPSRCYAIRGMGLLEFVEGEAALRALTHLCPAGRDSLRDQTPRQMKLLQLNDDCLMEIFQRMPLDDQVRAAHSCRRLRLLFGQLCRSPAYRSCRLEQLHSLTPEYQKHYFKVAGGHITELTGQLPLDYGTSRRLVELVQDHCRDSVRRLSCQRAVFFRDVLEDLLLVLPNLVEVRLRQCNIKDHSVAFLPGLRALKLLDLSDNFALTGRELFKLQPGLEVLRLNSCIALRSRYVRRLVKWLPALRELQLEQVYSLRMGVFKAMLAYGHCLESLSMATNAGYELLAQLPSLKSLTLFGGGIAGRPTDIILPDLASHQRHSLQFCHIVALQALSDAQMEHIGRLQKLRFLIIPHNRDLTDAGLRHLQKLCELEELVLNDCPQLSNSALLELTRCCPKLRSLHIEGCIRIDEDFILELIRQLHFDLSHLESIRKPLSVMVERTRIPLNILRHPAYLAARDSHLLAVYFKANATVASSKWQTFYQDRYFSYHSHWRRERFELDFFPRPLHQVLRQPPEHVDASASETD